MKKKHWWIVFLLGLLMPGLGHIYIGRMRRGIISFLLLRTTVTLILFLTVTVATTQISTLSALAFTLFLYLFVVFDAVFHIYDKPHNRQRTWYTKPIYYLTSYLVGRFVIHNLFLFLTSSFLVRTYMIPSESMVPTLAVGDNILADVLSYKQEKLPNRGDVVVFKHIGDGDRAYCKRVSATAGDSILITPYFLEVNGEKVISDIRVDGSEIVLDSFGLMVPKRGELVSLNTISAEEFLFLYFAVQQEHRKKDVTGFLNIYVDGVLLETVHYDTIANQVLLHNALFAIYHQYRDRLELEPMLFIDGQQITDYQYQSDHYFVVGDNWSQSYDSRYFGTISSRSLLGEVKLIYLSFGWKQSVSYLSRKIRWNRIGRMVE